MEKNRSPFQRHEHEWFYKYTNAKVAKIALVNRTLRWSSPVLFNDPFDVPRELPIGFQEVEFQAALANEVARILENQEIVEPSAHPKLYALVQQLRRSGSENIGKLIAYGLRRFANENAITHKGLFDEICEYWESLRPQLRILCLSEVNDSMSMWYHYADKYKGVVLGLKCIDEIDSPWLIAQPVKYQDAPPFFLTKEAFVRSITGQQPLDYKKNFIDHLYIKTTDWEYEKEWRVATVARPGELGHCSDYPIHPRNFGAIYLGQDISEEDETDILARLDHELSHVSVYKVVHISKERRLRFDKVR